MQHVDQCKRNTLPQHQYLADSNSTDYSWLASCCKEMQLHLAASQGVVESVHCYQRLQTLPIPNCASIKPVEVI
jgi:hypothetical protein